MKMSSKEALQDLRFYTSLSQGACPYSECNELCDLIQKDLELLEILKRNLYVEKGTGKFKGIEIIQCSLGNQHSEDFYKVKEWLEDGE